MRTTGRERICLNGTGAVFTQGKKNPHEPRSYSVSHTVQVPPSPPPRLNWRYFQDEMWRSCRGLSRFSKIREVWALVQSCIFMVVAFITNQVSSGIFFTFSGPFATSAGPLLPYCCPLERLAVSNLVYSNVLLLYIQRFLLVYIQYSCGYLKDSHRPLRLCTAPPSHPPLEPSENR